MNRNHGLDLIRALSVVMVLVSHWNKDHWSEELKLVTHYIGSYGVHLFFVLSGFLVGGMLFRSYQKTGQVQPWTFLLRRGIRIYPMYYICLLLTALIRITWIRWKEVLYDAFYIPLQGVRQHFWTLKAEEHFYIFAAFVFWLATTFGSGGSFYWTIFGIFLIVPLIQMVLRAVLYKLDDQEYVARIVFHSYGSIAAGVLLALVHALAPKSFETAATEYRWWIALPALLAYLAHRYVPRTDDLTLSPSFAYTMFDRTANRLLQTLLATFVVFGFYGFSSLPSWWRPLLWIGFHSYTIYLFHMEFRDAGEILRKRFPDNVAWEVFTLILYITAALGVGGLIGIANSKLGNYLIQKYAPA